MKQPIRVLVSDEGRRTLTPVLAHTEVLYHLNDCTTTHAVIDSRPDGKGFRCVADRRHVVMPCDVCGHCNDATRCDACVMANPDPNHTVVAEAIDRLRDDFHVHVSAETVGRLRERILGRFDYSDAEHEAETRFFGEWPDHNPLSERMADDVAEAFYWAMYMARQEAARKKSRTRRKDWTYQLTSLLREDRYMGIHDFPGLVADLDEIMYDYYRTII